MTKRVSKWFAMGHSTALKNLPKSQLANTPTENQWQKSELAEGYDDAVKNKTHIQFWLVDGEFTHDEIEKLIEEKK